MTQNKNRKPFRPLWIGLKLQKALYQAILQSRFKEIELKIKMLGFNEIILGGFEFEKMEDEELQQHWNLIEPTLKNCNIQCFCKIDSTSRLKTTIQGKFLWISQYSTQPMGDQRTFSERIQDEIQSAEGYSQQDLIFYLPYNDSLRGWKNPNLLRDLSLPTLKKTRLAFPKVAGLSTHDHLPNHPFLRDSYKQALPVINGGLISQGEGFWPFLALDLMESSYPHFITLLNSFPGEKGFLSCNLSLINHTNESSIEEWFKLNRPEIDYFKNKPLFKNLRQITLDLSSLRYLPEENTLTQEEKRLLIDHLLSGIKVIQMKTNQLASPLFQKQIHYFLLDIKRIVYLIANQHRIDLPVEEDPGQDSIWTKATLSNGFKVSLLDYPNSNNRETTLNQIYLQNILDI